jgi:glucose-6-phosphate 1-dehydrogenase
MSSADPGILVIFGASGDLTRRKLLPALYNLKESSLLPQQFAVLGVARPQIGEDDYRAQMREQVRNAEGEPLESTLWQPLEERLHYLNGEFDDPLLYQRIAQRLLSIDAKHGTQGNYLFYFAVPPALFATVARQLAAASLNDERDGRWRRIVIEKPFGYDLASARALNAELSQGWGEAQIYRIDHYLGKETVQNIIAFRFGNGIFEPIWNRRYVDHVQMTVAESVGVEGRGAYYEQSGALRDIVQNHMFQLLTLVGMEPPISFGAEEVRDGKVKVLRAIPPLSEQDVRDFVVRGQYGPSSDGTLPAYRNEKNVNPQSNTETFVALRLFVENWRWAGVPFYLRTGKRMHERRTEIAVQFKQAPLMLFRETPIDRLNPNVLKIRIQPDEGISLAFEAKRPGPLEELATVEMNFSYAEHFGMEPSTGYETLLYDAMTGDQTLFHRMDIVEAGWQVVQPILETWKRESRPRCFDYAAGTEGPPEAAALLARDGRTWCC